MKYLLLIIGFWTMNGCNAIFRRAWPEVIFTVIGMVMVFISGFIFTMDSQMMADKNQSERNHER